MPGVMLCARMRGPIASANVEEISRRVSVNNMGFCFCGMALDTCVLTLRSGVK